MSFFTAALYYVAFAICVKEAMDAEGIKKRILYTAVSFFLL